MSSLRIISFSELDTADQCSLKHQLAYVERWTKPQPVDSALSKGTAWHRALEVHYTVLKAGGTLDHAVKTVTSEVIARLPAPLNELIMWMYQGYVAKWGADGMWKILAVEHAAQVRLPTPHTRTLKDGRVVHGKSGFVLKVKIDLVVQDRRTGYTLVVDHKSGKDLPHGKTLEYDDQFPLYTWAMQQLGRRVFGQSYNAARTLRLKGDTPSKPTPLDERFCRVPGYRTEKELMTVAVEAYQRAASRYREQKDADRWGVDSPRHTNSMTCSWRCDYSEPCLAGRKGMDMRQFLRDKGFIQDHSRH